MQTVTRKQAMRLGLKRYFTGKPCKYGCISERYTITGQCIAHTKEYIKQYMKDNAEHLTNKANEWKENNREKHLAKYRRYRERHLEACKEKDARYAKQNKGVVNAKCARRRASKRNATPLWVNKEELKQVYLQCPVNKVVDHIIPLVATDNGQHVACGLHVPWNLQYLTQHENQVKYTRLEAICRQ